MKQNKPTLPVRMKTTLYKAVFLSISMLALGSASAYAASPLPQSCPTTPDSVTNTATVYHRPFVEVVHCKNVESSGNIIESKIGRPPIKIIDGTGWVEGNFDNHVAYTCDRLKNKCEFTAENWKSSK